MNNHNNGYLSNTNLSKKGTKHTYTKEQIEDFIKCKDDIIYFAEKYYHIIHVDKGKMLIPLYEYQKDLLLNFKKHRFNISKFCRQAGKCLSFNTIINVRNKQTGEIRQVSIGELYENTKNNSY